MTPPETNKLELAVAANFVAEGIRESLQFWFQELRMAGNASFAPFDQVIQQLLDPSGVFSAPTAGVILLQAERWLPRKEQMDLRNIEDFIAAMKVAVGRLRPPPFLVLAGPASPELRTHGAVLAAEQKLREGLASLPGVDFISSDELLRLYPVDNYKACFDRHAQELAQIPYARLGFATLGTMVARWLYRLRTKARKVIVVDCDNTLWSGTCGEDGPLHVAIGPERKNFQQFLLRQMEGGRLLCLCSKNEEKDVWAVFDRPDAMVLRREHLAAWKINWQPKIDNLRALSSELDLGLESFVFIDDDTFECEAVRALCPQALILQLPHNESEIQPFLRNVWDLDQRKATDDDRNRTLYYRQNAERIHARNQMSSLEDFLAGLQLEVHITPLAPADLERAAQLTERTNQFNLNGLRRSVSELKALIGSGPVQGMKVDARDRFGDYGTIGLVIHRRSGDVLQVSALLLSCRALGKGIEQRLVAYLARAARSAGARRIEFAYRPTAKNAPMQAFLDKAGVSRVGDSWMIDCDRLARD